MRLRLLALALAFALPAGLLSACSSSGTTTNAAPAGSSSATKAGAAGAPIVIGDICSCSGPVEAPLLGGIPGVARAWQDTVNNSGGIDGHPVKVIVLDDAGNPATSIQDAKTLVMTDHVLAVVGGQSIFDSAFGPYLASKNVPLVGTAPTGFAATSPDGFPAGGNVASAVYGMVFDARAAGRHKIASLVCAEAPVCSQAAQAVATIARTDVSGMAAVYKGTISFNQPSYASACLAAKQAGADTERYSKPHVIEKKKSPRAASNASS